MHSHVIYFWEALEQMPSEEISGFINFCSGRSRLPQNPSEKANLKLTGPARILNLSISKQRNADSRGAAAAASVKSLRDHSLSATAAARGHT